jgi:hypothetical protein
VRLPAGGNAKQDKAAGDGGLLYESFITLILPILIA